MLSKEQAALLWTTSWCSLLSSLYGIWQNKPIAALPGLVFITSINYWRDPVSNSPRRYADIGTVIICASTQMYIYRHHSMYMLVTYSGVAFYPIARYFSCHNRKWASVISHCIMHIVYNIANIILYSSVS